MKKFSKTLRDNWIFLLMVLPGALWLILFFYIPVFGNVVAFKDYHMTSNGFIDSIINSKWVGLDNFRFLFSSRDAFIITRNTVLYNLGFIFLGLVVSVGIAIILSELRSKRMVKIFQTSMLFPYFLSWVIISFFTDAFLNIDKGVFNHLLESLGLKEVNFYADLGIWPYLLLFLGIWKGFGYSSVMYYATIMGIDPTYYEAATVDGASKWQRIRNVTIPQLTPLVTVLTILAVGNIFRADFGLFYQIPHNAGQLYNVTNVLDVYVFNGLTQTADIFFSIISGLIALSCILPFVFVIIISVTDEKSLLQYGYSFFPSQFGLDGFEFLAQFKDKILQALFISVFVTVVGTLTNVFITTTYAYAISRTTFKYRRFFTIFVLLSMLFNAGLVPGYIMVTRVLQLGDTVWALIVPMLLSPFNIILMRSFFKKTIPEAILESARIDGASEARIFFQICLPLSLPGIATITLLTALGFWNDWFNALLYIKSDNLYPLQYLLMQIQQNMDYIAKAVGLTGQLGVALPKETGRMAMVVVATLPIAILYPFFQRYFVKGLTIGGVKE